MARRRQQPYERRRRQPDERRRRSSLKNCVFAAENPATCPRFMPVLCANPSPFCRFSAIFRNRQLNFFYFQKPGEDGIKMAKGAMALFRMTVRMSATVIRHDCALASHCLHAGGPRLPPPGRVGQDDGGQGGLHEEAAQHKAGGSNRTCAHRVQLLKQNPVQAHKPAQQRRGWRAVDWRGGR